MFMYQKSDNQGYSGTLHPASEEEALFSNDVHQTSRVDALSMSASVLCFGILKLHCADPP